MYKWFFAQKDSYVRLTHWSKRLENNMNKNRGLETMKPNIYKLHYVALLPLGTLESSTVPTTALTSKADKVSA